MFLNITSLAHCNAVGESGIHPIFSAIVLIHLFVQFAHHHRLYGGKQFSRGDPTNTKRRGQRQRRAHVPTDYATARGNAQLTTKAGNQLPDLPSLIALWLVQDLRAVFAGFDAGLAVSVAPAEGPFGKGVETFFS